MNWNNIEICHHLRENTNIVEMTEMIEIDGIRETTEMIEIDEIREEELVRRRKVERDVDVERFDGDQVIIYSHQPAM